MIWKTYASTCIWFTACFNVWRRPPTRFTILWRFSLFDYTKRLLNINLSQESIFLFHVVFPNWMYSMHYFHHFKPPYILVQSSSIWMNELIVAVQYRHSFPRTIETLTRTIRVTIKRARHTAHTCTFTYREQMCNHRLSILFCFFWFETLKFWISSNVRW